LCSTPSSSKGSRATAPSTCPTGLHPDRQGVEVIVERILPTVETFLGRIQQR
jgi:hypothetical protein